MRTVQIIADDFEGLYQVDNTFTDKQIKSLYKEFEESDYSDFEEYVNEIYSDKKFERIFVDEVYV